MIRRKIYVFAEGDTVRYGAVDSGRAPFVLPHGEKPSMNQGSQPQCGFRNYGSKFGANVAVFVDNGYELVWDKDGQGNRKPLPKEIKRSIKIDLTGITLGEAA